MRILSDEREIKAAQAQFESVVARAAQATIPVYIGHPNGTEQVEVHWIDSGGIWAYFGLPPGGKSLGRRYWNAFGLDKPMGTVSIACEINPPIEGIRRGPAGAFAEANGEIHVLHRGTFNAFRGRVPRKYTRETFAGNWVWAEDGDRQTEFLLVGVLSNPTFATDLVAFVKEAAHLKKAYKRNA